MKDRNAHMQWDSGGCLVVIAVLALLLLLLTGCCFRGLNSNDVTWGVPRPCIIWTTLFGPGEEALDYTAEKLLEGSYGKNFVWGFVQGLPVAEQERFQNCIQKDREFDRWALKNIMDLWAEMWWRDEDHARWSAAGYDAE